MARKIAVILGDGIGPDVIKAALNVLDGIGFDAEFVMVDAGYSRWEREGVQIAEEDVELVKSCDACLKGPTLTPPGPGTFKSVAVTLRKALDLYANVRPVKSRKGAKCLFDNVDMVVVRENTEGLYSGLEERTPEGAIAKRVITRRGSERIARFAFEYARAERRRKVTIVHKANILKETCGLFRDVCFEVAKQYPEVEVEEQMVDAAAYRIACKPYELDVVVTTNLFGDILSDVAAAVTGGLGLAPGANIGDRYAMFEPVHGIAQKYAGKAIANPSAAILSAAMMLKWLGEKAMAERLEAALNKVIEEGKVVTKDLGGTASTFEMAAEVVRAYEAIERGG